MTPSFAESKASLLALALLLAPTLAHAGDEPPADVATAEYARGAQLLREGDPASALVAIDASYRAQQSPNTLLLRGHALRLLGRRVEAMSAYEDVARTAGERVRAGEARFETALADSGRWIAVLRSEIGEVSVAAHGATPDGRVTVDGAQVETRFDASASTLRAHAWHEPGRAVVTITTRPGMTRSSTADVRAGAVAEVGFDLTPPAPLREEHGGGPPLPSWIAWGVGAAGLGVFAVFGAMASSIHSDLAECEPRCAKDRQDDVDAGKRDQTIANVALVTGVVGTVAGFGIWLGSAALRGKRATPAAASRAMTVRF